MALLRLKMALIHPKKVQIGYKLDQNTNLLNTFENHLTLYHLVLTFVLHCIRVIVSLADSPLDMLASPVGGQFGTPGVDCSQLFNVMQS